MLPRITVDVLLQVPHCHVRATRTHEWVIERHVIHQRGKRQTLAIRRGVTNLTHSDRSPHEAILERKNARRAAGLLHAHLERSLIHHATGITDKAVLHATVALRFRNKELSKGNTVLVAGEVALHAQVRKPGAQCGSSHARIAVAKHVYTDAVQHVPLHAAIK